MALYKWFYLLTYFFSSCVCTVTVQVATISAFGGFASRDYGVTGASSTRFTYLGWCYWLALAACSATLSATLMFAVVGFSVKRFIATSSWPNWYDRRGTLSPCRWTAGLDGRLGPLDRTLSVEYGYLLLFEDYSVKRSAKKKHSCIQTIYFTQTTMDHEHAWHLSKT